MVNMDKQRVIFLCTGNAVRSQMAEAFVRKYAGDRFEAYSAGLEPRGLHPLTIQVMDEVGIDVSGQHSKGVTEYLGKVLFQYLITVSSEAEKEYPHTWPGVDLKLHWFFEDPSTFAGTEAEKLARFREVRDQIERKVLAWLETSQKEGSLEDKNVKA
jgi:arsenate reductase